MGETTVVFRRDETIVGNCDDLLCFETKLNRKKLPVNHKSQAWLMANIDPQKEFHGVRKRIAACLLVDTSGSMAGEKIKLTIQAAKNLVDALAPEDYVSMVRFDSVANLVFEGRHLRTPENQAKIKKEIEENTEIGGITNLKDGLDKAINELDVHKYTIVRGMPEPVKRIFLLTDGYPNKPSQSDYPDDEFFKTASILKREHNIQITTIGIGNEYGIRLLNGIARNSGGLSYHLTDPNMIPQIFAKEVGSMTGSLALQPTLHLKFEKSIEVGDVYQAQPRVWKLTDKLAPDVDGGLVINLSDITRKEMQSYLIDLRIPEQREKFNGRVGWVMLKLKDEGREYQSPVALEFSDETSEVVNPEVTKLVKIVLEKTKIQEEGETKPADWKEAAGSTIISPRDRDAIFGKSGGGTMKV
ncbi:MAG: von Willebrand factor type A domain protein [Candidatus Argoarchaeum ethanivorans]|uniref:von Willebrand factor type A domain protein n=1 Tax=Candidatus Argoarchaeum ethanivorans TaxID=2608793 RepID=A0A811T7K5_9EURY|nr:MAG: von Willebrand factor type A domain protein [Candidatus Argoarchaeum ethanivorans]